MKTEHGTTLIGESPEMQAVLRAARLVAATDVPVLIEGESGTGKELLARDVHRHSRRAGKAFISVNCAALPEALAESLLYGHRKGAFTGAVDHQQGYVGAAHEGILFLDEVGELSLPVQAKLLRFLESGEFQPVGQAQPQSVDVRVIAATNRCLEERVRAGEFREDLYYRLRVVPLELPPLRQRQGDVGLLTERLSAALAARHGLEAPRFTPAARRRLEDYGWPGNVRELRNFCERMVVLFGGRVVDVGNLPAEIRRPQPATEGFRLPAGGLSLQALEVDMIRQALQQAGGNRSRAARLLGLSRDTLLYRIRKHAIEV
ncbi:MAG TPA: sigma-54-dependent Fis family transcriptional regulator [Gammaproteobacteria bacterium]|nr:sigma-54-dependent Fis family transcriptional regulator [Gammaproteobacteria bacterium]